MKKVLLLTLLLAPALLASSARAADPASVTGVEKYLRDDEKAFLAAILTSPAVSAQFDADAPLALKDPKNLGPFLGVWRGKMEAYAEVDGKAGNPNLDGRYSSYSQLMTPAQKAYMLRRMPTMKEDDRNSLIDYLKSVNDALTKNGELTWYTKKVVAGIMDHYRTDLNTYVVTPMAQTAKRDAASSAEAFAAIRKVDEDTRLAAAKPVVPEPDVADAPVVKPVPPVKPVPVKKPAAKPAPVKQPAAPVEPDAGSVAATKPAGGALDQARNAANAGAGSGTVFDGGGDVKKPSSGDAVIVPAGTGDAHPTLSAGKPGSEAGLVGSIPSVVPSPGADDMDALMKMRSKKPAPTTMVQRLPMLAGGLLGGILGGVIGFLLGGPVGAIIGAAAGIAGGAAAGHVLAKKLFQ